MFTDIKNIIFHPSHCLTSRYTIGIIETKADSSFLLHHFLSFFLKENCSVVFLSFCQSFNHFNTVGNKIGNNLIQARDQKHLLFIDGLKGLAQTLNSKSFTGDNQWNSCMQDNGRLDVKAFYKRVKEIVDQFKTESDRKVILVIDNLSILVDTGLLTKDVMALIHYINNYITKEIEGTFLFGVNNDLGDQDEEGDHIKKFVQHSVDLSLEVKGLETGYCKDVHGQVINKWVQKVPIQRAAFIVIELEMKWYNSAATELPATRTSQFKLTDKTCAVFASGMSSAVL